MKLKKKKSIVASAVIFGLNISTANDFYIVKKGDTPSILQVQHFNKSIYGKHGSLPQTLSLNPNIRLSGGNKIFPKMKIVLVNTQISPKNIAAENSAHQPLEAKLHNQSFKIGHDLNLLKANGNSTNYQNVYWKYTWETL